MYQIKLLRDTPEPGTPNPESPLNPGAARINPEAAKESAEDTEAVVDQLLVIIEGLLPWLKDDISSSGSSNPRTPSPDIELENLLEFEAAAQRDPTPELSNEVIGPDLEHLNEISGSEILNQNN